MREQQPEMREKQPESLGASSTTRNSFTEEQLRWLFMATVPGLACALLGPLGTYEAPFTQRALFWIPTMAIGAVMGGLISIFAQRFPPLARNTLLRFGVIALLMSLIMTFVVQAGAHLVFGVGAPGFSLQLLFYVSVMTLIMSAIAYAACERHQRGLGASAPPVPLSSAQHPALSARLPVALQNQPILALQAEDHYVRVHTPKGSDLILIRLSDAAAEMAPVTGARTHRSWWVNRSAVQSILRRNAGTCLVLTNQLEVPVGRSYASELREAGWMDG